MDEMLPVSSIYNDAHKGKCGYVALKADAIHCFRWGKDVSLVVAGMYHHHRLLCTCGPLIPTQPANGMPLYGQHGKTGKAYTKHQLYAVIIL